METESFDIVPVYKLNPKLKKDLLRVLGNYPYNSIAGLMFALDVEEVDYETLQKILNSLGALPYVLVQDVLLHMERYLEIKEN